MKRIFAVCILWVSFISCKQKHGDQIWTKQYEQDLYKSWDEGMKQRLPSKAKRDSFVSYSIKRLKLELPDGIESVSNDSFRVVCAKIGKEYAKKYIDPFNSGFTQSKIKWSPELEGVLREGFFEGWDKEGKKDKSLGNKFCDCFLVKLHNIYPDSVLFPIQTNIAIDISKKCKNDLRIDQVKRLLIVLPN
jgi:hypothetical protein